MGFFNAYHPLEFLLLSFFHSAGFLSHSYLNEHDKPVRKSSEYKNEYSLTMRNLSQQWLKMGRSIHMTHSNGFLKNHVIISIDSEKAFNKFISTINENSLKG